MAQQIYRGYKKEQVSSLVQAAPTPDSNETFQNNQRRAQGILSSINNLVNAGNTAVAVADKGIQEHAIKQGKLEGGSGEESTANEYAWGGEAQQKAYNSVRAELVTRDMPSTIEQFLKEDQDIKKPLDEMSEDERAVAYSRARNRYFKEKGIDGSAYQEDASMVANEIQSKHLSLLNKQAVDLRQAKATRNVSDMVALDAKSYQGDPAAVDAAISSKFDKYAISLGGSKQAQEAVANGLLSAVMSPTPSMEALRYLKSPEAKDRFSSFEGFDHVVKQADTYTLKVQNAYKEQVKKQAESGFYINLSGGAFTDRQSVDAYLDQTNLDPEDKFNLRNKALNYLKVGKSAADVQGAFDAGKYNIVNSQKPEVLKELFNKNVGNVNEMLTTNMNIQQENALIDWVKKGYEVPKEISNFGNAPINNGDSKALDGILKYYSTFKTRLGPSGTGTIFDSKTQGKAELWARLRTDTTLSPADRKLALDKYDDGDKLTPEGISFNATIAKELSDNKTFGKNITEKATSFASEGGTNVLSGPDDLQPTFTFTSMTKAGSEPSLQYAKDGIVGNYKAYRLAGISSDEALQRAQSDFQKKNQWVTWEEGSNKNSYIPKEFGDEFATKSMKYLEKTRVMEAIALAENLSVEDVRKRITIQPARDYNITRQVSVFMDGIEKNIPDKDGKNVAAFTADQFHQESQLMDKEQLDKVIRDASIRSQSPTFIKQQQQLSTIQSLMKGMTFGP